MKTGAPLRGLPFCPRILLAGRLAVDDCLPQFKPGGKDDQVSIISGLNPSFALDAD